MTTVVRYALDPTPPLCYNLPLSSRKSRPPLSPIKNLIDRLRSPKSEAETAPAGPTFAALGLIEPLLRALEGEGYERPTPIQTAVIAELLKGRDVLGCAQTGTGKTAAFALPILQSLVATPTPPGGKTPRVLVLAPTRELAIQIGDSFGSYGRHLKIRHTVIFGGVGQEPQVRAMRARPDIVVATPGRLLDLMNQRLVDLSGVGVYVLDEADRMLDMGFIHDVKRITQAVPRQRQTLLFSATMPNEIQSLADNLLKDPFKIDVTPRASTATKIEQRVYFVDKSRKRELLLHLLEEAARDGGGRTLVFTRTKHLANRVAEHLVKAGVTAEAIHGNKSQSARQRALTNFKSGTTRVLVASDLAARGIDIDEITHVVNFDLPDTPETYVHRIGRTGRAEASGIALSFVENDERRDLQAIERVIKKQIEVVADHPFPGVSVQSPASAGGDRPRRPQPGGRGGQGGQRNRSGGGGGRGGSQGRGGSGGGRGGQGRGGGGGR